jgi:hypothetical protein
MFEMPCSSSPSRAQAKRFMVFNRNKNFIGKRLSKSGGGGSGGVVVHSLANR